MALLSSPAQRALENAKITSLTRLSKYSKSQISELHGIGPSAIKILQKALQDKNLKFKK